MTGRCCESRQLEVRGRTRSVAAVDFLGDPQAAQLAPQVDRQNTLAASFECVAGVVVAITDFIERVADTVVVAELRLLACLEAQGIGLIDLALSLETAGRASAEEVSARPASGPARQRRRVAELALTVTLTHTVDGQAERALPGFPGQRMTTPSLWAKTVKLW